MLLPPLTREDDEEEVVFVPHNYNQKQCTVIDKLLDSLKDFFHHDSVGVKEHILTSDIKQLKIFTKLYKQTTEALISEFMKDFASKADYHKVESCGEVSLEINAFRHPATGEFDGTIRVISAYDLHGFKDCLLYTSPSPRDRTRSRMPSSA